MKGIFKILEIIFLSCLCTTSFCDAEETMGSRVVAIIAKRDFRDEELFVPKKVLEDNGFVVVVASQDKKRCTGSLGAEVTPDITIDEINIDNYEAILFIGGSGSAQYFNDKRAHKLAQDAISQKKVVAAICIAPVILANAGVLSKKRATVWSSEAHSLVRKGAFYTGSNVESDGNIITADGPTAAKEFAELIVKRLKRHY